MNTADTRNVPLLQQTLQHIKDHPEQHDQTIFFTHHDLGEQGCGTFACFAGWGAILSGWSEHHILEADMWVAGATLFGLTRIEARTLFRFDNTLPMLELMVKDLVNDDPLMGHQFYEEPVAQGV